MTLFYAVLFPDGRLTYCNAGHNAPMLVSTDGGVQRLDTGGMVIGLFDGTPFEEANVQLHPGDVIVIFSDGVSEAMDANEEEFGDDRLLDSLVAMTATEVQAQLKHVFASVSTFTAGADQNDDVTAMVVGYRGVSGASSI